MLWATPCWYQVSRMTTGHIREPPRPRTPQSASSAVLLFWVRDFPPQNKSNFCRFYASYFSFKSAPPISVLPKAMRETRTKRKNHDGGATKPPFSRPRLLPTG